MTSDGGGEQQRPERKAKQTMSKRSDTVSSKKANDRRYVRGDTVPRSVAADRILLHNHVRHTKDMPCGVNGFRAWTQRKGTQGNFKKCHCGWAGLPHYAQNVNYRCETVSWEELER